MNVNQSSGWKNFRLLWVGQAASLLGTSMTRFALLIWAFQQDGRVTNLALLGFFSSLTYIAASPFAGVVVDRLDRRKVMFFADLGAGLMTAMLLALGLSGNLLIWHLYLAEGIAGACEAFQEPAFSAAVSQLVPRESYTRANALMGVAKSASRVLAPALGGALLQFANLNTVLVFDLFTMFLGLLVLLMVRIPKPAESVEGQHAAGNFWHEMRFGFGYIFHQPGLRALLLTYFLINLFSTITYFAVLSPMILARTGGNEVALGTVRTIMGLGGILSGILISVWGTPRRKTRTYLVSTMLSFLTCDFMTAVSRSVAGWATAGFISELTIPLIVSPYYALWQENVPEDVQGRVFATREMVQVTSVPFGFLMGGLLADRVFEPLMMRGGALAELLHPLVGSGPGAGMSVMFLCTALLGGLTGLLGLFSPSIRKLDMELKPRLIKESIANAHLEL